MRPRLRGARGGESVQLAKTFLISTQPEYAYYPAHNMSYFKYLLNIFFGDLYA
jgi:hypothetical protein